MAQNASNTTSQSSARILSQTLDIGCKITTPSSYAKKNDRARPDLERKEIGRGVQGAVFEQPGRLHVLKKEHPGNRRLGTNIRVEHILHELVSEAFDKHGAGTEDSGFPDEYNAPDNAIEMERILPMPKLGAGVDVGDVEFVFGTRFISQRGNFVPERQVGLFILDFGRCKVVNLSKRPSKVYGKLRRAMVTARSQMFIPDMFESTEQRGMDDDFGVGAFLTEYEQYVEEFL
ncbi:hypothetical protein NLG97_g9389 [Lecanicillium saksenae]|uniref:Uncharacterized protein n=1 Tax=Lecanicillium saksenae TaxID=468837 RepID=A0ACC1QGP4_9HYPO|nr:hypothetical protein NLG97_g9389 [Lecanicillium saksenae]